MYNKNLLIRIRDWNDLFLENINYAKWSHIHGSL